MIHEKNTQLTRRFLKIFGTTFAGSLAFIWLLLEIYSYFQLQWLTTITDNVLRAVVMMCVSIITALCTVLYSSLSQQLAPRPKPTFEQSLIDSLETALESRHYAEVIRIGVALNRPLFEAGEFSTRLKIGRIVEEAAALSHRKDVQIVALIDAIGWSLVELGQYEEAKRHIAHGIELSEEIGETFYRAKGQRHLGVIARRTKDFESALKYYRTSLNTAQTISDNTEREAFMGGLNYALASLYYHTEQYEQAMEEANLAIDIFSRRGDEYRLNMSQVLKGDIQVQLKQNGKAQDTFRAVLQRADKNTEKLHVARSRLGLAEIYIAERNWRKAQECVQALANTNLDEFKAEAERLKQVKAQLPPLT